MGAYSFSRGALITFSFERTGKLYPWYFKKRGEGGAYLIIWPWSERSLGGGRLFEEIWYMAKRFHFAVCRVMQTK